MKEKHIDSWLKQRKDLKKTRDFKSLYKGIRDGNNIALSAAITLVESTKKEDQEIAKQLILKCLPHSGNSIRIAVTGVPGVGKSCFIEEFGKLILKDKNKVAVLAIDPSSTKTGGSILGDKTRMTNLSTTENVFIRPSATGNNLGGVARSTRETIILCEAANYDTILIETVGVGQSETTAHSMVDFFLLLMLSGAGDELQGIKRGIMELADAVVITKADGENVDASKIAKQQVKNALHLFPSKENSWTPKVEICSSQENYNLDQIWNIISEFSNTLHDNNWIFKNRIDQEIKSFHQALKSKLFNDFLENKKDAIKNLEEQIKDNKISAFQAAESILYNH